MRSFHQRYSAVSSRRSAFRIGRGVFLPVIVLLLALCSLSAQTNEDWMEGIGEDSYDGEIGLLAGYGFHTLSGDLDASLLSGDSSLSSACGTFQDGSGQGISLGVTLGYHFLRRFRLEIGLGYADYSGTMRFRCIDPAEVRMPDGSLTPALTDHVLTIDRQVILSGLDFWYRPVRRLPIDAGIGIAAGLDLTDEFTLQEEIVEPISAEFVAGGQRREYGTGSMATDGTSGLSTALMVALSGELPAGETLLLRPQIRYYHSIGDPSINGSFREHSLRLGLQVTKQIILFPPDASTPLEPGEQ